MSAEGATAITRLVDLCETFHLPVVSLTDQGGLTIGRAAEAAFRARLEKSADPAAEIEKIRITLAAVSSPFRTAERFGVADLIDPRDSRPLLCAGVRDAYRVLPELVGPPSFGARP